MTGYNRKAKTDILKIRKKIQASLKVLGPLTAYQLADEVGTSQNTIVRNLEKLQRLGVIEKFKDGRKTYWQLTGRTRKLDADLQNPNVNTLRRYQK